MGYYSPNPHYAPDDFSEDAERLEACEQEAGRYFASVTSRQKTEFDNRMAYIRPWSGSPRWERERAAAQRRWDETTAEARALLDRTVRELMLTGEVGPDLDAEWVQLASKEAAKSIDAFRALGGKFAWETEAEQVPA